ncbi:MarR family winged helix-turn-helix transcriptional regulator [Ahrensia kielensis]|uniref:MarR family winged helix-turn-helix transcriptional regulator n=1 Tax=Ahrensia kielensis TaxID=76980 RepID=UPI00038094DE|nr:MarR family winged helix-turn-helix transcriptional regulator [Ahrensia kielensis]
MSTNIIKQAAELRRAIGALSLRFKSAEAEVGSGKLLNPLDMQILLFVSDHPACKAAEVARHLLVAATTISSATDRLTRQGLLSRERPEKNRRVISLSLTVAGQAYVSALLQVQTDHCLSMLEKLSPDEQDLFIQLFRKISQNDY